MERLIFLLGFMGSGKSFTGKALAERLNMVFIDLDDLIEQQAGRSIRQLFAEEGEAAFRRREAAALRRLADQNAAVVACGGGAPCFKGNMQWMNAHGITVFLDTPVDLIADRLLREMDHRPLLQGLTPATLPAFIEARLEERSPFYRQAALIYRQEDPATDVARALAERIDTVRRSNRQTVKPSDGNAPSDV